MNKTTALAKTKHWYSIYMISKQNGIYNPTACENYIKYKKIYETLREEEAK